MIVAILKVTRHLTGSQCSFCSAVVMCDLRSSPSQVGRPRSVHVEVVLTSTREAGKNGVTTVQTTEHERCHQLRQDFSAEC